mmetsp:Transcript_15999/g.13542  ORF Transcript_15999/g.13542 Transcript_15999/m.13542 type:complete len:81 (+) Transcript_15999:519-761(+)
MGDHKQAGVLIEPNPSSKYLLKIPVIGDAQTGKSSIISRYLDNQFDSSYKPTVALDIKRGSKGMKLWDTSGNKKMNSLIP